MHESIGLRERKKAETRTALGRAALSLALERGLDGVTADDIATAANVSVRTFHNYFASKEDAVVAAWRSEFQVYVEDLKNRPADEPILASLESVFAGIAADLASQPEQAAAHTDLFWTSFVMGKYRSVLLDEAIRMIVDTVAARTGTDTATDVYPHLVTSAAISAIVTAFQFPADGAADPEDRARLIHECFALLRHGLQQPEEAQR